MFKKKNTVDTVYAAVKYPSGVAVATEGGVYYIKGDTRFKYFSDRVFQSWKIDPLPGSLKSVSKHTYGGVMGFRDGTLIYNIANGRLYLVSGNKVRHIQSPDVFARYGLDRSKAIEVSQEEVNLHNEGEPLT